MEIVPLRADLKKILKKHYLVRKFTKQKKLCENNSHLPKLTNLIKQRLWKTSYQILHAMR